MNHLAILMSLLVGFFLTWEAIAVTSSRFPREYTPETSRNAVQPSCCIIPTCDEDGRCYETLSCGHVCSQGKYRFANDASRNGYRRKLYYSKYSCNFGECKEYRFLCMHCPHPDTPNFNYNNLRGDCRNCYDLPHY